MLKYNIQKIDSQTDPKYDIYQIELPKTKINYYEALNNQLVSTVEVIFKNNDIIKEYEPNKIYIYFDNITNINNISDFLEVLNTEYNNLKFNFIINNKEEINIANKLIKRLNITSEIIESSNYYNKQIKPQKNHNEQYKDYDLNDNIYIKKFDDNEQKLTEEEQKEYANYNGYNERFINENVKDIVSMKNNNSNNE